ncbi:hypothetical protein CK214_09985 [Mesorhizobium sp. WSM3882]|nr:hypothetical protein CK214_09985 [Mesorhizobium sp. WSM3882]
MPPPSHGPPAGVLRDDAQTRTTGQAMDRSATVALLASAGAAPHLSAGILSPYDGERGALIAVFANRQRC